MSVRRGLFLVLAERAISTGATFVAFMVLARLLTPEEIGVYSVGAALIVVAHALRDFGIANYVLKERDLTRDKLAGVQTVAILTGWTAGVLVLIAAAPAADFYAEPRLNNVIRLLSINFFLLPIGSPILAILRRNMEFGTLFRINAFSILVQSGLSVLLAFADYSYFSLIYGSLAGTFVTSFGAIAARPKLAFFRPRLRGLKSIMTFGMFSAGSSTIGKIASSATDIVIGKVIGFAPAAIYSRGQSLPMMAHDLLVNAPLKVIVTALGKEHREDQSMAPTYLATLNLLSVVAWPAYAFLGLNSDDLLLLFFGDQWLDAARITQILAVAFAIATLSRPGYQILVATGNVKRLFNLQNLQQTVHFSLIVIFAHQGLEALAYAIIFNYVFAFLSYHVIAIRPAVNVSLMVVLSSCLPSLVIAGLCGLGMYGLSVTAVVEELPLILRLFVNFCGCAVVWLCAIFLLKHPVAKEAELTARLLLQKISIILRTSK